MPIQFLKGKQRGVRTVKATDQYDLSVTSLVHEDRNLLIIVESKNEITSKTDLASLQFYNLIVLEIKSEKTVDTFIKHLERIKKNL